MENTITETDYQLIEDFFARNLDKANLSYFEHRLKEDIVFAQQVELYKYAKDKVTELYHPIQKSNENKFKARLNGLKKKEAVAHQQKKVWAIISSAAAIAVLVFFTIPFFTPSIPNDELATLANSNALEVNLHGIANDYNNRNTTLAKQNSLLEKKLVAAFSNEDYNKVLVFVGKMKGETSETIQLIKGITYRKLGQTAKAIPLFQQNKSQRDIALWNLATIYLEQKPVDKENARKYLKVLIEEDFNSKKEAQRILDNL